MTESGIEPSRPTNEATPHLLAQAARTMALGQVLYILITQFHAGGHANSHVEIFRAYAESASWELVHLGQFVAMVLILSGLAMAFCAINCHHSNIRWKSTLGVCLVAASIALFGALQAIDGVALKQSIDSWVGADSLQRDARFAAAETVRWLEWGLRSYFDLAIGLALIWFATVIAGRVRRSISLSIKILIVLSGLAYLAQGWIAGVEGFSDAQSIAIVSGWVLSLTWMIWLSVHGQSLANIRTNSE